MPPVDMKIRRLAIASRVATAALGAGVATVSAECDGPFPPFRTTLPTAERVVIGDVIGVTSGGSVDPVDHDGASSRFTLRVRYVPRGVAPSEMEIIDLPTQPCAQVLLVHSGDRIAVLFGGTAFVTTIRVNVAAWIRGTPQDFPGVETITVREVFDVLGLDPPDTSTVSVGSLQPSDPLPPLVMFAGLLGLLAGLRRFAPAGRGCDLG